jgi:hypothetical protein
MNKVHGDSDGSGGKGDSEGGTSALGVSNNQQQHRHKGIERYTKHVHTLNSLLLLTLSYILSLIALTLLLTVSSFPLLLAQYKTDGVVE